MGKAPNMRRTMKGVIPSGDEAGQLHGQEITWTLTNSHSYSPPIVILATMAITVSCELATVLASQWIMT